MTPRFDYLFSSFTSLFLHGALAAGFYNGFIIAPQIDFSAGDHGISVEFVPSAALGSSAQREDQANTIPEATRSVPLSVSPKLSEFALKLSPPQKVSVRYKTPRATKPQEQTNSSQSALMRTNLLPSNPAAPPCSNAGNCGDSKGSSGDIGGTGATLIQSPKPPYPWGARRAGFEGHVIVNVTIAKDGRVQNAELLKSSGREDCDYSAVETIKEQWRFEPARLNGVPIEWREKIVVVYNLQK